MFQVVQDIAGSLTLLETIRFRHPGGSPLGLYLWDVRRLRMTLDRCVAFREVHHVR